MILIIDLCYKKDSLSSDEFVIPILNILKTEGIPFEIKHYSEMDATDLSGTDGLILCGTALKDNLFFTHTDAFCWLKEITVPVLGICAGMQILTLIFSGSIREDAEIGMTEVRVIKDNVLFSEKPTFQAYELHSFSITPPDSFNVIAVSDTCIQAVKHKSLPIYGVMFHPEVRNEWVVTRFLDISLGI